MHTKILFIIAIFGAFSATLAEDLFERQFTPINSLTESLLPKSKPQISSLSDTATVFSATSSSSETLANSSSATPANVSSSSEHFATSSAAPAKNSASSVKDKPNPYNLPNELMPLWDSMTMRQKAAQMIMVFLTTSQFIIENEIGGVLITGKHFRESEDYLKRLSEIESNLRIPLFIATDQEGGAVNRLASYSDRWRHTPSAREMRLMDTAKIRSISNDIAKGIKTLKVNMNLAPVLDPAKDYREKDSFMEESKRSWGSDTTNAYKVRSFVHGMLENGIICVSKHFPGYDSWTNSDHQIAISASPREKIENNVQFFKTLADDIPVTMMSSVHFLRISSRPAVFDGNIVKMTRRRHPDMVVLTDDLWGTSLRAWASGKDRLPPRKQYPDKDFKKLVTAIIDAGNDILMISYTSKAKDMLDIMMELSDKSSKYKRRIEESAARILKLKYKAGILK